MALTQTFALGDANVCNRPRKRLQPLPQTFAGKMAFFFSAQQKKHGGEEGIPNKSRYSRTPIT